MRRFLLLSVIVLVLPVVAFAAEGLVPCLEGNKCTTCDLVTLTNNIIRFVIIVLLASIAFIAAWAGFFLLTSGGEPSARARAAGIFTSLVVGLLVMLAGWLVIDTIMKILLVEVSGEQGQIEFASGYYGPWNQIPDGMCSVQDTLKDGKAQTFQRTDWELVDWDTLDEITAPTADVCDAAGSFGNVDCTRLEDECAAAGGTPTVVDSDPSNYYVSCEYPDAGVYGGGNGSCTIPSSGYCSPSNLDCFGSRVNDAAQVCTAESGGNPSSVSGTDLCKDGKSFSGGLFQVNILANNSYISGCDNSFYTKNGSGAQGNCLKCSDGSTGATCPKGTYCKIRDCQITDVSMYKTCMSAIFNPTSNLEIACKLYSASGNDFDPWAYSANKCGVD